MRNYLVLTPVRGLPRADRSREPINAGDVIALPSAKAMELGVIGAVEPSGAEATVLLDWPGMHGTITALSVNGTVGTDRDALIAAIEALGGIVFFVGDGLPDRAEDVLSDFSNDQLLAEIVARIDEARLQPTLLSGLLDIVADVPEGKEQAATDDVADLSEHLTGADAATPPPPPAQAAEAKAARKPKASAK